MEEQFKIHDYKTPMFSLNGIKTYGRIVDVTDGDTLVIVIPVFENKYFKFSSRLTNIDTCETRSKNLQIKQKGLQAKYRVVELLCNKNEECTKKQIKKFFEDIVCVVWVECFDFDKYGRLLANVFIKKEDTKSISDILIDEKLACKYNGETKLSEEEQIKLLC